MMPVQPIVNLCYMDLAVKLKLRYSAVLHLAAHMEGRIAVEIEHVRRILRTFPPVGALERTETAMVWAGGGMMRGDARASLTESVHAAERSVSDFALMEEKHRENKKALDQVGVGV